MPDKNVFIDTNLWIYEFLKSDDKNDLIKKDIASEILKKHFNIFISNQVINEIINVLHRKYKVDIDIVHSYIEKILNICNRSRGISY